MWGLVVRDEKTWTLVERLSGVELMMARQSWNGMVWSLKRNVFKYYLRRRDKLQNIGRVTYVVDINAKLFPCREQRKVPVVPRPIRRRSPALCWVDCLWHDCISYQHNSASDWLPTFSSSNNSSDDDDDAGGCWLRRRCSNRWRYFIRPKNSIQCRGCQETSCIWLSAAGIICLWYCLSIVRLYVIPSASCSHLRAFVTKQCTWHQSKDGDVLRLGRWVQAWRKVMVAYRRGWLKKSLPGWLPVHRDQLRTQRSVTSMGKL